MKEIGNKSRRRTKLPFFIVFKEKGRDKGINKDYVLKGSGGVIIPLQTKSKIRICDNLWKSVGKKQLRIL